VRCVYVSSIPIVVIFAACSFSVAKWWVVRVRLISERDVRRCGRERGEGAGWGGAEAVSESGIESGI